MIKEKVLKELGGYYNYSNYDKNLFEKVIDKTLKEVEKVIKEEIRTDLRGIPEPQCESLWRILEKLHISGGKRE